MLGTLFFFSFKLIELFGVRVMYRELYMNKLEGAIPDELGGLKSLVSLDFYHNNFTGPIPPSLSKLSNLRFL